MIQVTGITKTFGKHTVLDGVDLDVRAGEIVALLGPNGAGKTTLVNILTTLVAARRRHRDGRRVRRRHESRSRCGGTSASPASRRRSTGCSPAKRTCG